MRLFYPFRPKGQPPTMKHDLVNDPESELSLRDLRLRADRLFLTGEYTVAYQRPVETDERRGYLSVWVRVELVESESPVHVREYGISGDDEMIRRWFSEMAAEGTPRIERLLDGL